MPLHNQTRSSVRIREVAAAVASLRGRAQPTLLQLAREYQSRDPALWLEVAPHPLPTKSLFRYPGVLSKEEEGEEEEEEEEQEARRDSSVFIKNGDEREAYPHPSVLRRNGEEREASPYPSVLGKDEDGDELKNYERA